MMEIDAALVSSGRPTGTVNKTAPIPQAIEVRGKRKHIGHPSISKESERKRRVFGPSDVEATATPQQPSADLVARRDLLTQLI
jgi:hypothetical protein